MTPFLDLVFVKNIGISYSHVQSGQPVRASICWPAFAVAVEPRAVGVDRAGARQAGSWPSRSALIIGGALGNAIDRVLIGGVADFFSLHAFGFYWYVFNIADVAIVAGVVGLLYDSYKCESQRRRKVAVIFDEMRSGRRVGRLSGGTHVSEIQEQFHARWARCRCFGRLQRR